MAKTTTMEKDVIFEIIGVHKSFAKDERSDLLVLEDINLKMHAGEIVALLGKSGSGKSTLLRIIAGLTRPSKGIAYYRKQQITGPIQGVSMVFQSFALMPWLTVLQNVELGLEAQGVSRNERRERAIKAIDTIGLDGFESAYPKELSGGMRQRVGFARALVVNPDLLLMDEPFSALDVLTAENLKTDLLDLWQDKKTNTNGILIVTHNIEEAAMLADRILIFGSDPGHIRAEIRTNLAHPRDVQDPEFRQLVDHIYTLMTTKTEAERKETPVEKRPESIGLGYRLPDTDLSVMSGLLESLATEYNGRSDLPTIVEDMHLNVDNLFALTEAMEILRFAKVSGGDISITPIGYRYANADILEKKKIFAQQLMKHVPLAKHIRSVLDMRHGQRASKERFINELEDFLSEEEAERVLTVLIGWGRYAEILAYDDNAEELSLENPS
jgi:NitT/TauT family transport system ATP-binding protein